MDNLDTIVDKYAGGGALLDANLMLLLVIGSADRTYIENFSRTRRYTENDFIALSRILRRFRVIHTTPNILTEASNLMNRIDDKNKSKVYGILSKYITVFGEHYVPSVKAGVDSRFPKFGLTDVCILLLVQQSELLLITDDFPLAGLVQKRGYDVINFNHVRESLLRYS